jgi:hypothetical protein
VAAGRAVPVPEAKAPAAGHEVPVVAATAPAGRVQILIGNPSIEPWGTAFRAPFFFAWRLRVIAHEADDFIRAEFCARLERHALSEDGSVKSLEADQLSFALLREVNEQISPAQSARPARMSGWMEVGRWAR